MIEGMTKMMIMMTMTATLRSMIIANKDDKEDDRGDDQDDGYDD